MIHTLRISILLILMQALYGVAYGQEWRDTLNKARSLYQSGKYKEALKYYKTADRLAPNDVDLSEETGQTAYKAGDFKTAETCYEQVVSKADTPQKRMRANTNLGEARMQQKNYAGAVDAFKSVLRENPSNEKARQRLMEAQRMQKQQEQQRKKEQQQQQQQQQQNSKNQKECNNPNQNQQNQSNSQQKKADQNSTEEQKLQDKQTERKLDELSRQELATKKRLDGSKGTKSGKRARKDW